MEIGQNVPPALRKYIAYVYESMNLQKTTEELQELMNFEKDELNDICEEIMNQKSTPEEKERNYQEAKILIEITGTPEYIKHQKMEQSMLWNKPDFASLRWVYHLYEELNKKPLITQLIAEINAIKHQDWPDSRLIEALCNKATAHELIEATFAVVDETVIYPQVLMLRLVILEICECLNPNPDIRHVFLNM